MSVISSNENSLGLVEVPVEMVFYTLFYCKEPTNLNQVCSLFYNITGSDYYQQTALLGPTVTVLENLVQFRNRELQMILPPTMTASEKVRRLASLLHRAGTSPIPRGNLEASAKRQYETSTTAFAQLDPLKLDESFIEALYSKDLFNAKILTHHQFSATELRFTALMKRLAFAIMIGDQDSVKRILQEPEQIECPIREKLTRGFTYASGCGQVEIMELILNHAKVLQIQLAAPDTALYTAAKNGHLNAAQFILAHANNPSIRSTSSELLGQAVIMAASVGDEPTVKFLLGLDVNIEPNGPSGLGRALCLAADGGFTGILEQIFQHHNSRHINRHGDYSLGLAHSNAVTHLHFDAMNLISKHQP